jgi:hypothetical protein
MTLGIFLTHGAPIKEDLNLNNTLEMSKANSKTPALSQTPTTATIENITTTLPTPTTSSIEKATTTVVDMCNQSYLPIMAGFLGQFAALSCSILAVIVLCLKTHNFFFKNSSLTKYLNLNTTLKLNQISTYEVTAIITVFTALITLGAVLSTSSDD